MLVVVTGCAATAGAKAGYLSPRDPRRGRPGPARGLEAIGIPPVLHLGSCVDNSRILTVLTQVATEGGLGEDIDDLPAVGLCPEWMCEKAIAIGTYFAASGAHVIFGVGSPVRRLERGHAAHDRAAGRSWSAATSSSSPTGRRCWRARSS